MRGNGCLAGLLFAACSSGASGIVPDTDAPDTDAATADVSTGSDASTTSSSSGDASTSLASSEGSSSSTGEPLPEPGCDNGLVAGDFCFMQVSDYGPFAGASSLATADFDNDELADLAVAATDEDSVYVVFGDGLGTFVDEMPMPTGGLPQVLVAADFNLDDDWDLATSNLASADLSVIYGLSGPAFDPDVTFAVGDDPRPMVTADLDGNGYLDIVVAREGGPFPLRVLMGTANGLQVSIGPQVDAVEEVLALAAADLDGDTIPDLLATVGGTDEIVVLLGDGLGELAEASRLGSGGADPYAVTAADLDGDRDLDVLVGNRQLDSGEPNMRVFDNAGDGTLEERGNYPEDGVGEIATGDIDADGDIDAVLSTLQAKSLVTLRNDGTGVLSEQDTFDLGAGSEPLGVIVADLNADGVDDFATADRAGWRLVVYLSHP